VKTWIQTALGHKFDLFDPKFDVIKPYDIAHALSNLCRFTGHCAEFYSIAEHCVRVSFRCEELVAQKNLEKIGGGKRPEDPQRAARWGLLHDAAEAYVNDLNSPLKHQPQLLLYREIEKNILNLIAERFELGDESPEVKVADDELLATEFRDLMKPLHKDLELKYQPLSHVKIACWVPSKARRIWLKRFIELFPLWENKLA
jgi:5'-deoxynucleotidase YfbR-like HD superfamily hydrolase